MSIQTISHKNIQYHILKTNHEGFVTGECLIPMGERYADFESRELPGFVSSMLMLGTQDKTESELSEYLESRGIQISTGVSSENLHLSFICLTQYLEDTIAMISEIIASPRFDKTSFEHLKQRMLAGLSSMKDDTGYRARVAFTQALFPKEHMSRLDDPDTSIDRVKKVTLNQVKGYHQDHTDFSKATWIFVGDVSDAVKSFCEKHMPEDEKSTEIKRKPLPIEIKPSEHQVNIKDKQSVDFMTGHAIDIDRKHKDYLPLMIALDALGGSFSARLMRTVRDEEGLTYNVRSTLSSGSKDHPCFWVASGSFAPKLLKQGIESMERQLNLWVKEGLSQEEFEERKAGLLGKYQVMLSDANNLVRRMGSNLEQGFSPDYLYAYCNEIEKITLEDVNRVLKQYVKLDQVTKVSAGTLENV